MGQVYTTSSGKSVTLEKRLGGGGEGEVWTIQGSLEVAKIYLPQAVKPKQEYKLKAMVADPPVDEMRVKCGHVSIAWPSELLYQGSRFAGFIMPMVEQSPTIFSVYNPQLRRQKHPGFDWHYLYRTALNLSIAIDAIHRKHYLIGDINESNILVKPSALVSVIDTDSFQVKDSSGQIHRCLVGKEDYTPPELWGAPLDKIDRLPQHDYFGLGVLLFRLLMEGFYPFAGVLKQNMQTDEPAMYYCMRKGAFPYVNNSIVGPPPLAPKFEILPPEVQKLMTRCFVVGHKRPQSRPSPGEWVRVLEATEKTLIVCKAKREHYYSQHLSKCPWCEREVKKQEARMQKPLPPARAPRNLPSRPVLIQAPTSIPGRFTSTSPRVTQTHQLFNSLRNKIRGFFYSPGRYLDRYIWWSETRKFTFLGGITGIGLFFLVILIFKFPVFVGYAVGAVTAGLIVIPTYFISRYLFRLHTRQARGFGTLIILLGGALTIILGIRVAEFVRRFLSALQPQMGWLFLDSLLVGTIGGTSYGNYKTLSRRKSRALASSTSVVLVVIPLIIIGIMGLFSLPFQPGHYTPQLDDTTFTVAKLMDIGQYDDTQTIVTIETSVRVTGIYRATVNGEPYTCQTIQEFPTRVYCLGPRMIPNMICRVIIYPIDGSDPLFTSTINMPP
jgi:hypothetical protein